jgi:hypothetical protein
MRRSKTFYGTQLPFDLDSKCALTTRISSECAASVQRPQCTVPNHFPERSLPCALKVSSQTFHFAAMYRLDHCTERSVSQTFEQGTTCPLASMLLNKMARSVVAPLDFKKPLHASIQSAVNPISHCCKACPWGLWPLACAECSVE